MASWKFVDAVAGVWKGQTWAPFVATYAVRDGEPTVTALGWTLSATETPLVTVSVTVYLPGEE